MHRLTHNEWFHVMRHLSFSDAVALQNACQHCPRVRDVIMLAQDACTAHAIHTEARLVTRLFGEAGDVLTVVTTPREADYLVGGRLVQRRMYVHDFPRACLALAGGALVRVESFLAFQPHVVSTLHIDPVTRVECEGGETLVGWPGTTLGSTLYSQDPRDVLQRHARFYVQLRVRPGPKRQRGRRARRWTKV